MIALLFPGDVQQKPGANEPSPKPSDDKYERPPFPGDAPGTNPTGGGVNGESSSKDTQIDTDIRPDKDKEEPAAPAEDESVLQPWNPHKAAKDVEVGQYYLKLKNYRAALERFNHALTYKQNDAEAIFGLAITQEKLDLLSLAAQNYRKYLEILPNGPKSKDAEEGLKRVEPHVAIATPSNISANPAQLAAHDIDVGKPIWRAITLTARESALKKLFGSPQTILWYGSGLRRRCKACRGSTPPGSITRNILKPSPRESSRRTRKSRFRKSTAVNKSRQIISV